jgi:hypothetical protein
MTLFDRACAQDNPNRARFIRFRSTTTLDGLVFTLASEKPLLAK